MQKYILAIFLAFIFLRGSAQFYGGNGDGFSLLERKGITLNSQTKYCSGGNGDGFTFIQINGSYGFTASLFCSGGNADGFSVYPATMKTFNTQSAYCAGGNADGFCYAPWTGVQFTPSIFCSGGNADGFGDDGATSVNMNSQSVYCGGGINDGFGFSSSSGYMLTPAVFCSGGDGDGFGDILVHTPMNMQPAYCSGGNADGFTFGSASAIQTGTGIWTGLTSNSWTATGNWKNLVVPDATINVTIPAGCPNYPALAGTLMINNTGGAYNAKRLDIADGASVTNTGALYAYGVVNISGSYVANNSSSNTQRIYSGGEIIVNSTGNVRFGNQSSGTGYCDLLVNSGGNFELYGGVVDVDDQVNVMNGGTFTMTDGLLFIHRFGNGSAYSSSYPGSLYVDAGASGTVSGGTVKMAGKATVGSYTSVNVNSSSFSFTGSSVLHFTDGVTISSDDVDLKTASGGILQNLVIDRPERIVSIISNTVINGDVTIEPESTLKISSGADIQVNGDVILQE
ncbi:MAG: hypothetical protein NTX61_04440 [Bacteroidetes bacterium]|nr:hypothetical protein [Bacteroidota bacterium]